jgi:hypothetical protein
MSRTGLQSMLHYGICKYNYRSSILLVSKRYVICIPIRINHTIITKNWQCAMAPKSILYFSDGGLTSVLVVFIDNGLIISVHNEKVKNKFTVTKPEWDAKTKTIFEVIKDCWNV